MLRSSYKVASNPITLAVLNLNLQHHQLSHASEACCWDHIHQSPDYTDKEKNQILHSSLALGCSVCTQGKQVTWPVSKAPQHSKV
jgi:hypothetical protein